MSEAVTAEAWGEVQGQNSGITTDILDTLATKLSEAEKIYEDAKEKASALYREVHAAEQKLVEALNLAGKRKYHVEGIGTYFFEERYSVKVPATIEDKKMLANYLQSKGGDVLFWDKFSINSNSLQSLYKADKKEYLEKCEQEGTPELAGLFSIPGIGEPTSTVSLKLTKERKK